MAWIIGIDEAGYGPNLGPFVMTAVALRVPDDGEADLWQHLAAAVRRATDADDGRLLVADSKVVYSPHAAWDRSNPRCAVSPSPGTPLLVDGYVADHFASSHAARAASRGTAAARRCRSPARRPTRSAFATGFVEGCRGAGVTCGLVRGVIVCAEQFNALTDAEDSKGAVLRHGLAELIRECWQLEGDEPLTFFIDKHGGRNTYAAMLQDAVPEGMVLAHRESLASSVYSVVGLKRAVRWTFQPRHDADHLTVALASMVSKYVRELLMGEFNRFWLEQVPGLKPTAGYPGDARRFFEAISSALQRLGIAESAVWAIANEPQRHRGHREECLVLLCVLCVSVVHFFRQLQQVTSVAYRFPPRRRCCT